MLDVWEDIYFKEYFCESPPYKYNMIRKINETIKINQRNTMKISPKKGYILAANYEFPKEKKGILILEEDNMPYKYMIVLIGGDNYLQHEIIFVSPYKPKIQVDENLFLIDEDDVLASVEL